MSIQWSKAGKTALIALSLAVAVGIDLTVEPRDQFVTTPFAIPILIATYVCTRRWIIIVALTSIAAAGASAYIDRAPPVPTGFHLVSLIIISVLGVLLEQHEQESARQAQEAQQATRTLQTLIDVMPAGVLVCDEHGKIILANAMAQDVMGDLVSGSTFVPSSRGVLRRPDGSPLPPGDFPLAQALESGAASHEVEIRVSPPGKTERTILAAGRPVSAPDGRITGAVVVFQDMTERKRSEEEIERLREEWMSVVAHDLRQPVTLIMGFASVLARQLQGHPDMVAEIRATDQVMSAARSLNKMIGDLLDFSRIEAGHLRLERKPADLVALLQLLSSRVVVLAQNHSVRMEMSEGPLPVDVDSARFEQILGNLLANAAKYSDPGREITLLVGRHDGDAEIVVESYGAGIAAEELPHLFSRFYRPRLAGDGRVAGLDLGLYITRGLVEAHGGKIWVESVPNQSTTFHFTLPLRTTS
ncbi:MAG TPA: PAS domain-containing sensor histidine kinase [Chloroflexota bacterium]|nr:PAS domain-containing sensor histidine kinase [Chloroflexota bacterium]